MSSLVVVAVLLVLTLVAVFGPARPYRRSAVTMKRSCSKRTIRQSRIADAARRVHAYGGKVVVGDIPA